MKEEKDDYKESFLKFISISSPEELTKFILDKGKEPRKKKIMVRFRRN